MTAVMSRLRPDDPSRSRHPSAGGPTDTPGIALLPIAADLLPRETTADRRGRKGRVVAIGLVATSLLVVGGGAALSTHARTGAEADLAAAQDRQRSLVVQQRGLDTLVQTQTAAAALQRQLTTLMAGDISWRELLDALAAARGGVSLTSVQATGVDPADPAAAAAATPGATPDAVGTLSVNGVGADKPTVAAFVEAMSGLTGVANVFVTTVTASSDGAGFSFTVQADLTSALRTAAPGRWATTSGGGK